MFIFIIALSWLETTLENRLQEEVELIGRAIKLPLQMALEIRSERDLLNTLESAFSIKRVYGIFVYDEHGQEIWAKGHIPYRTRDDFDRIVKELDIEPKYEQSFEDEVFSYFIPLFSSRGDSLGLLQITRQKSEIFKIVSDTRYRAGLVLILISVFLTMSIFLTHKYIIEKPIKRLINDMDKIGSGQFSYRATADGPLEVAGLAKAFNIMLDNIERYRDEVELRRNQQRHLENELHHSEKLAAIGQLAAGVAHELGTPLSVIKGKSQRALRKLEKDMPFPDIKNYYLDIKEEADKMESIINQFMNFSQDRKMRRKKTSFKSLIESVKKTFFEISGQKHVNFHVNEPIEDYIFEIDAIHFQQIFVNLLKNSLNAVDQNGAIYLTWSVNEDDLNFSIEDSGPGVPKEKAEKIFEPFYTTKSRGNGIGLGLAVSLGIVTHYHGEISLSKSSQLGGAKFTVTIPRKYL